MAWDSSRTVPWRRLIREWLIYVVIAAAAMTIYFLTTDRELSPGLYAGLLVSGPMYVAFGGILAKFGYQRKTFKDLRREREAAPVAARGGSPSSAGQSQRTRPAPTKRTSTGPQHRKPNKR